MKLVEELLKLIIGEKLKTPTARRRGRPIARRHLSCDASVGNSSLLRPSRQALALPLRPAGRSSRPAARSSRSGRRRPPAARWTTSSRTSWARRTAEARSSSMARSSSAQPATASRRQSSRSTPPPPTRSRTSPTCAQLCLRPPLPHALGRSFPAPSPAAAVGPHPPAPALGPTDRGRRNQRRRDAHALFRRGAGLRHAPSPRSSDRQHLISPLHAASPPLPMPPAPAPPQDGRALFVNARRRSVLHHMRFKGRVAAARFSPSGSHFAVCVGKLLQARNGPPDDTAPPLHLRPCSDGSLAQKSLA